MKSKRSNPVSGEWPIIEPLVNIIWFFFASAASTVQPFLRVPGSAGERYFSGWRTVTGCIVLFFIFKISAGESVVQFAAMTCAILVMLLIQQFATLVRRWLKVRVHPMHPGISWCQVLRPAMPVRRAMALGEPIGLFVAVLMAGAAGADGIAMSLLLSASCSSAVSQVSSGLELSPVEIVEDDWDRSQPSNAFTRRISCRVIDPSRQGAK